MLIFWFIHKIRLLIQHKNAWKTHLHSSTTFAFSARQKHFRDLIRFEEERNMKIRVQSITSKQIVINWQTFVVLLLF